MKKSSIVALSALGVAVIGGGGAWAATTLATGEPTTTATSSTIEPTTEPTIDPTPTSEPTGEPTPTVEPTPEYTAAESAYLAEATRLLAAWNVSMPDSEILDAGASACAQFADGARASEVTAIDGADYYVNFDVVSAAEDYLC